MRSAMRRIVGSGRGTGEAGGEEHENRAYIRACHGNS
jgi:hypothetical protein